jgi:hypothetical protein
LNRDGAIVATVREILLMGGSALSLAGVDVSQHATDHMKGWLSAPMLWLIWLCRRANRRILSSNTISVKIVGED